MQQKQAIEFATVVKNGVIQEVGKSAILQPKPNFKGGSIKWYEDKARNTSPQAENPLPKP